MKNNLLQKLKHIYLVGIKGVGMTALAQILKSRGKIISGSDTHEKFFTDAVLKKLKIPFREGFRTSNLPKNTELVVYSTAFDPIKHPEILSAKKKKIPVMSYPEAVSALFNASLGIAVSGTHGKTTTSALIAESMKNLGLDPTALIGSRVANWQTNAITGKSSFFVIEADEHQNKLRHYRPWSIIITNIDYDHPDYYKKPENYYRVFEKWVGKWARTKLKLPKIGVFNGDDVKTLRMLKELNLKNNDDRVILTYGKNKNNDIQILDSGSQDPNQIPNSRFQIPKYFFKINLPKKTAQNIFNKKQKIAVSASLFGEHNAYNLAAAVAFVLALSCVPNFKLKISNNKIAKSFESFRGTERRMQFIGKRGEVLVYDDYAHHPAEIDATLAAVRRHFPKFKIFVIFQSHTFTRTSAFLAEFIKSLSAADLIGLLPIYGSARELKGKVRSADIAKKLIKNKKTAFNFPSHQDCLDFLKKYKSKKPTILITMGAGDGWRVGKNYLKREN
ncbi:MAG: UDP-N-acetylmuramate--L-alanine ligase [Candidatus Moranbacteria bacterium]|nr:UDP-N-acetylmuramate--L-alanine ligase [Candidatus Moranbacteria bacterium]